MPAIAIAKTDLEEVSGAKPEVFFGDDIYFLQADLCKPQFALVIVVQIVVRNVGLLRVP